MYRYVKLTIVIKSMALRCELGILRKEPKNVPKSKRAVVRARD